MIKRFLKLIANKTSERIASNKNAPLRMSYLPYNPNFETPFDRCESKWRRTDLVNHNQFGSSNTKNSPQAGILAL